MNKATLPEAYKALAKGEYALQNAEYDLRGGFYLATANRAYYTCFYCMTALLYTKNTFAKTHQGVQSRFAELFIKTNEFPATVSAIINDLFDNRQEADYDLEAAVTLDEATGLLQKAAEFLKLTKAYFDALPKPEGE
ncbi:MAG TPA: HEPN domain-containing protein [Flavisolibacter sp.]|jgi:uncharacterized protein (UPF0332 family)